MLLVVYELTFKSLVFLVVVGDLSLSVLHILFELSLIEGVPHLQHPFTSFFPVQERPFEIVPIGPSQGAPPIELISLDAPNIGRPSCQMYFAIVVISLVIFVISLVNISVSKAKPAMAILAPLHKVAFILVVIFYDLQPPLTVKDPLHKISLVLQGKSSVFVLFEQSLTMVISLLEITLVSSSIRLAELALSVVFIVLEIAFVPGSVLCHEDALAVLDPSLDGTLVAGPVRVDDLAVDEPVVSEQSALSVVFSLESPLAVILEVFHMTLESITVLFGDIGVSTVAIFKSPFQLIAVSVVNPALSVFFLMTVDFSLVVAPVKIFDLAALCPHPSQLIYKSQISTEQSQCLSDQSVNREDQIQLCKSQKKNKEAIQGY